MTPAERQHPRWTSVGKALLGEQVELTTVEQPIDEIAETAIEALRALVDDPEQTLPTYVFRPRLRIGGTTGPPPN